MVCHDARGGDGLKNDGSPLSACCEEGRMIGPSQGRLGSSAAKQTFYGDMMG